MRKSTYLKLEELSRKVRGYVGTKKLLEEGFSNRQIARLMEEKYLEKICHGYYWIAEEGLEKPTDYKCIELCLSNPRAVVCMESALFYQGMIKKEPEYLSVATERTDRSLLMMNFPVKRHYFSENYFQAGVRKIDTEFGCYNIYDIERSVCDIYRLEAEMNLEIVNGIRNNEQQYKRLKQYEELLRIKNIF